MDPFEAFQIATCHIAEGDYDGALPLLEAASSLMAGDPDFDALLAYCREKMRWLIEYSTCPHTRAALMEEQ